METLETYLKVLLKELEDLDTIHRAQLYSGELHIEDLSQLRIPLSQDGKSCTVFVDYEGGMFEQNPAKPDKNFLNAKFTVYIVGYADRTNESTGFSSSCVKTAREINRLVQHKEFHKISGAAVGYSKPVQTAPALNGIKKGNSRLSLHIYTYEQKMDFDYE